jgi:hypothetical protein
MAAAWGEVCRQCVNTVVEIPVQILLIASVASLLGLFVLVSPRFPHSACTSQIAQWYPGHAQPQLQVTDLSILHSIS